jgi:SsrA-binding protein
MLGLSGVRVFIYAGTCDRRRQISGLMTMVREELGRDHRPRDPFAGPDGARRRGMGQRRNAGEPWYVPRLSSVKKPEPFKIVASNRKASHDFHLHERTEAGIVLLGSEVKSMRDAKVTIADGWVEIRRGEAWLHGVQVNEYMWANQFNHEVGRVRKLLMHKQEIGKLGIKTQQRGFTLIPLSVYFKDGKVKVELALVTHKKQHDKRESKREADDKREIDRAMKQHRR